MSLEWMFAIDRNSILELLDSVAIVYDKALRIGESVVQSHELERIICSIWY
jgi:hypothetical protein